MSRRRLKPAISASTTPTPMPLNNHEPSAWLRQATADVMAILPPTPGWTVVVPLGGHTKAGTRADRSCDRCGLYVAPGKGNLYMGTWQVPRPDSGVVLTIGLCVDCAEAEVPGWGDR